MLSFLITSLVRCVIQLYRPTSLASGCSTFIGRGVARGVAWETVRGVALCDGVMEESWCC